jgi:hypothetical protein
MSAAPRKPHNLVNLRGLLTPIGFAAPTFDFPRLNCQILGSQNDLRGFEG